MSPTKEQDKTPERGLNEMEITSLLDKDFKVTVIKLITDLRKRIYDFSENVNKEIERVEK